MFTVLVLTFSQRLRENGVYNYENVRRRGRNFPRGNPITGESGGLAALKTLYVPIDISNTHWIFIKVDVGERQIELYDSFGRVVPDNNRYLGDMKSYV